MVCLVLESLFSLTDEPLLEGRLTAPIDPMIFLLLSKGCGVFMGRAVPQACRIECLFTWYRYWLCRPLLSEPESHPREELAFFGAFLEYFGSGI